MASRRRAAAIASLASAISAASALSGAPALGESPAPQTLTPPPPSFYTCEPVGGGTLCKGTISESFGPEETGLTCGSGDQAFTVFDSGEFTEHARRWYDRDGNLTRRVLHDHIAAQSTNPVTGATVPYRQRETHTTVLATPGALDSATTTHTGVLIYTLPGQGQIALEAGRVVEGPDGIEFRAGPQDFVDYYENGDTSAVQELCSALGAPG
jgi:hypothetical protein